MPHLSEEKEIFRTAIIERLNRMSPKDKEGESRSLCKRALEQLPQEATSICAFYPMYSEVQIKDLLEEIIKRGHQLYLPCFENKLVFRKTLDLASLVPGKVMRIPEPSNGPILKDEAAAIVIVPGLAFTKDGKRMGRGNGGYDIWIRAKKKVSPNSTYWAVCYECQVVPELPMEEHDEKVDRVITDRGIVGSV